MNNLLTPEEKKYLRRFSNFLLANDMDFGTIRIEYEYKDLEDIKLEGVFSFDNNYSLKVPKTYVDFVNNLIRKISNTGVELYTPDSTNYAYIEVTLDVGEEIIKVNFYFSYTEQSDVEETDWEKNETDVYKDLQENFISVPNNGLKLEFNGSGDSGYIEDDFVDGQTCPDAVKDWCYNQLENQYGGWEINEGSSGNFTIYPSVVRLYFWANVENNESQTLFEERFEY